MSEKGNEGIPGNSLKFKKSVTRLSQRGSYAKMRSRERLSGGADAKSKSSIDEDKSPSVTNGKVTPVASETSRAPSEAEEEMAAVPIDTSPPLEDKVTGDKKVNEMIDDVIHNLQEAGKALASLGENFEHELKLMFVEVMGKVQNWVSIAQVRLDAANQDLDNLRRELISRATEMASKDNEIAELKTRLAESEVKIVAYERTFGENIQRNGEAIQSSTATALAAPKQTAITAQSSRHTEDGSEDPGDPSLQSRSDVQTRNQFETQSEFQSEAQLGVDSGAPIDAESSGGGLVSVQIRAPSGGQSRAPSGGQFRAPSGGQFRAPSGGQVGPQSGPQSRLPSGEQVGTEQGDEHGAPSAAELHLTSGSQLGDQSQGPPTAGDKEGFTAAGDAIPKSHETLGSTQDGIDHGQSQPVVGATDPGYKGHPATVDVAIQAEKSKERTKRSSDIEAELCRLKKENERIIKERAEYENAIQRALLRGVSSLNAETLKVLKCPPPVCYSPCGPPPSPVNMEAMIPCCFKQTRDNWTPRTCRAMLTSASQWRQNNSRVKPIAAASHPEPEITCCTNKRPASGTNTSSTKQKKSPGASDSSMVFLHQNDSSGVCGTGQNKSKHLRTCCRAKSKKNDNAIGSKK